MFFQDPEKKLPEDMIISEIFNRLPLKDALSLLLTSRDTNKYIKNDIIWKKFGAENFNDFSTKIQLLSKKLQNMVLTQQYPLSLALKIQQTLDLPLPIQKEWIFSLDNNFAFDPRLDLLLLRSEVLKVNGIIALHEQLLTVHEIYLFDDVALLNLLLTDNGLIALREKLITPAQAKIANEYGLALLLSENGLTALREHLISSAHTFNCGNNDIPIVNRPYGTPLNPSPTLKFALEILLSDTGMKALRENLITIEQAALFFFKESTLTTLLTENGMTALREKLISIDDIDKMNKFILHALLRDNGLTVLREKLLTPEQANNLLSQIDTLLSDEGIVALRNKLITPEEAQSIKDEMRLIKLIKERVETFNPTSSLSKKL